jgi:hypothetical protein
MLVAIRLEKEFGKWLYSFTAKDYKVVEATWQAEAQKGFCKLKALSK